MTGNAACDVLIIGAGATGSLAALVLGRAGLDVVCLEQGPRFDADEYPHSHAGWTLRRRTSWNRDVSKRRQPGDDDVRSDSSQILMWNGVCGSTNVYGAVWPRYRPSDFRKRTEHGLQPDWPIAYEDIAPFYEQADRLLGVAGLHGNLAMPPRDPCPTGLMPPSRVSRRLAGAFDPLDWHWWPVEAGTISQPYDGRPECNGCGVCNGCPRGSMSNYALSVWPRAIEAGVKARVKARVLRVEKGADSRVTGALYVDRDTNRLHFQKARVVIVAANGIGTPRLLLASDNLANASDQVGRNLMHHTLVAGEIFVDEPVDRHIGYTASSVVNKWHQAWDVKYLFIIDGSVLATGGIVNPTPTISALALRAAGHIRDHFADLSKASKSRVSA